MWAALCSEKCVTDSCYPPHQKMICIKASCVSMRGWHVLMFLHFRRSVRSQRCKRRQMSPPKGDLQRVLGAVTYPQRESVQRFSFSAFTLGKPVDKWSQRPTLWVCCNCREPGSGRYFLDFLSWKGYHNTAIATRTLEKVLQYYIGSCLGEESWLNIRTAADWECQEEPFPLPTKPLFLCSCWRAPVPSPNPSPLSHPSWGWEEIQWSLILKNNLMRKWLVWMRLSSLHWIQTRLYSDELTMLLVLQPKKEQEDKKWPTPCLSKCQTNAEPNNLFPRSFQGNKAWEKNW